MTWTTLGATVATANGGGVPWPWLIPVATALATIVVGIYTARAAGRANHETAQLTERSAQMDTWKKLADSHTTEIDRLRADRVEDQAQHSKELERCNARIDLLVQRVESAEHRADRAEKAQREIVAWARAVVKLMQAAEFPFPPPPPGVADPTPGDKPGTTT